jgi:hypothetical protein
MDIRCHVNPVDTITTFDIQNESLHFEWRDSNKSHASPFNVTSVSLISLSFNTFYVKISPVLYVGSGG